MHNDDLHRYALFPFGIFLQRVCLGHHLSIAMDFARCMYSIHGFLLSCKDLFSEMVYRKLELTA